MNFLADENFPRTSVLRLREAGFDVIRIQEIAPAEEDPAVLALAVEMQRVLLTFDRDFGELLFHKKPEASSCRDLLSFRSAISGRIV